jgi:hypothetical protein
MKSLGARVPVEIKAKGLLEGKSISEALEILKTEVIEGRMTQDQADKALIDYAKGL